MEYVLDLLKKYDIEYNRHTKILTINKPIEVSLFLYMKRLLKPYMKYIKDIRVETLEPLRNNYERRF